MYALAVVIVVFGDPESCWDIWERRDWVMVCWGLAVVSDSSR